MGMAVQHLMDRGRDLNRPCVRFVLIDRRPPEQQRAEPYVEGEIRRLDKPEGDGVVTETVGGTPRVTTPMFLGGAEHEAELRLPSFKGVLRFWSRALAWDRVKDVSRLRDEEAARCSAAVMNGAANRRC